MRLPVHLKHENRQTTGSFKLRGVTNALNQLSATDKQHGVIAASTGNHGRAFAYAARLEGIRAVILGQKYILSATRRMMHERKLTGSCSRDGLIIVPLFDNAAIIVGQGTIGLEIIEAVPDVDTVLVPISGGELATGVAAAIVRAFQV